MCGICGIIWKQAGLVDDAVIRRMNRTMIHRGPDDEGYYSAGPLQMAMRRLSIIDLAGGHQPISTVDGRYTIVFNGEIYNYESIRDELLDLGHQFQTNSDTETVLISYAQWGADCVDRLRGMFAFAIHDRETDEMFLVRDRLGIKPLLFINTPRWFAFASELKVLMQIPGFPRRFNHEALHHHLSLNALPTPMTLFSDVHAIPPGYRAWYRRGEWQQEQYWDVEFNVNPRMTEAEALAGVEDHLLESVKLRLISEVPLGAFLSGGVDSSLVVAMMAGMTSKAVRTFSIGWEQKYGEFNETQHARAVASRYGTDHHEHMVTIDDLLAELPKIIWYCDQPTPSAFQSYFVSKFTRSQGITVALSGLGGDEIGAGYPYYSNYVASERFWQRVGMIPGFVRNPLSALRETPGLAGRIGRMCYQAGLTPGGRFGAHRMVDGIEHRLLELYEPALATKAAEWDTQALIAELIDRPETDSIINRIIYHDLRRYMVDDPLTDTDRCSMAHSLEVRVPLIDHKLVEFAGTIPPEMKITGGETKYLLKKVGEKYLPHEVMYRRKMGFEFPMVHWIHDTLAPLLDATMSPEKVRARGLFKPEVVQALRQRAVSGNSRGEAAFLWSITVLELWCRLYLDVDDPTEPEMDIWELADREPRVSLAI
jgi:asparagine synthase (glutamine-hydrolysing)